MQPAQACSSVVDKRSASVDRQTSCWGRQTTDWLTREMYRLLGGACSKEKNKVGQGKEVSRQVSTIPDGGVPTGPLGGLAPAVLGTLGVGSSWTREGALPSHCTCRAGSDVSRPQRGCCGQLSRSALATRHPPASGLCGCERHMFVPSVSWSLGILTCVHLTWVLVGH